MPSPVAVIRHRPQQPHTASKSANDSILWVITTKRATVATVARPGFSRLIVSTVVTKVFEQEGSNKKVACLVLSVEDCR